MFLEIFTISNPVICEASLPNFLVLTEVNSERVRVATLDELHGAFECDIFCRCKQ